MREVTQAEYARYRKVSRKTVFTWKVRGLLALSATGRVLVDASDEKVDGRPLVTRGGVTNRLTVTQPVTYTGLGNGQVTPAQLIGDQHEF